MAPGVDGPQFLHSLIGGHLCFVQFGAIMHKQYSLLIIFLWAKNISRTVRSLPKRIT